MFERFTDRARKVMALATQEAQRCHHQYIGTEHILLGIAKEGTGVAANILKNLNADLRTLRAEVEKFIQPGPPDAPPTAKPPQTPRVKKALTYAIEESRHLNHNYVGTEHLLLGLLREPEGLAHIILTQQLGLTLDAARQQILSLIGPGVDPEDKSPDSLDFHLTLPRDLTSRLYHAASAQSTTPANLIRQLLHTHLPPEP